MEIKTKQLKHCDLITIKGRVDSYTASKVTEALDTSNKEGHFKIVLDLSGVEYMSSAGFRALLLGQRNCKRYNRGEVVLAAVPKRIYEAFDLTGFAPLFKMYEDTVAAVGSF